MNVVQATEYSFRVQGDLHKGKREIYSVMKFPKGWSCECFDWRKNINTPNYECKHIKAVLEYLQKV